MAQWSSSMKTQPIPLHHTHTPLTLAMKWCQVMLCHLASSYAFYFIVLQVNGIQQKIFEFISFCSFPPLSYISLHNAELSCCIATICFISTVDQWHSRLELKMPCHALFLIPSTRQFGNAFLGYVQHDPVGLVWYGNSYMNFLWPLIFKHHT